MAYGGFKLKSKAKLLPGRCIAADAGHVVFAKWPDNIGPNVTDAVKYLKTTTLSKLNLFRGKLLSPTIKRYNVVPFFWIFPAICHINFAVNGIT